MLGSPVDAATFAPSRSILSGNENVAANGLKMPILSANAALAVPWKNVSAKNRTATGPKNNTMMIMYVEIKLVEDFWKMVEQNRAVMAVVTQHIATIRK